MDRTVFISGYLKEAEYGKSLASELRKKLTERAYNIKEIDNHKMNVWCRDYMPVVNSENKMVQFRYAPGYMTDSRKWKERIPSQTVINKELDLEYEDATDITLDGGAIEIFEKKAIISDRVLRENKMEATHLLARIKNLLNLEQIIIVPQYPYDFTGHVDGMVRFIDSNRVLINDLSKEIEKTVKEIKSNPARHKIIDIWYYSFISAFYNAGMEIETLHSNYFENKNDKEGNGIYLNFLKLPDLMVMPVYEDKEHNNIARGQLEKLFNREVITIDASKLAREGGMINCVTWINKYSE